MKGRDLFKKVSPILTCLVLIFKVLPRPITEFIWSLMNSYPGLVGDGIRYCLAKSLAKSCGDNVKIGMNVEIRGWQTLELGNNVSIHRECYIDAAGGIKIGNDVSLAHQTTILSENHTWKDESLPIKYNPMSSAPVIIENDVWLGCAVRVLPGVHIETRSIVAAGAIVTKNVTTRTIVGGNPAQVLKTI